MNFMPQLVLSDNRGNVFVHPTLKMVASDGKGLRLPQEDELVPLPKGSTLYYLPGHVAAGWEQGAGSVSFVARASGRKVFPVAGFPIPGFTRLLLPAAHKSDPKVFLPLWPYTAVGWQRGGFYAAAVRIDPMTRQKPFYYARPSLLRKNIDAMLRRFPQNRLVRHLAHCAISYQCRNAQNLFLKRAEAPLPVAGGCNARCLGCLSFQDDCGVPASHERISFLPTVDELLEVAVPHLKAARRAMVSFGQGCEGEPLLQSSLLRQTILEIRRRTRAGTIHLNTNGFCPSALRDLAAAGLDSVRVSLNSLCEKDYDAYYRPRGYGLADVLASLAAARRSGLFVSLNLLTFPGFTDDGDEVRRLMRFLDKGHVDLLQLRNLSIDPEFFSRRFSLGGRRPMGLARMIGLIRRQHPSLRLGYFNPSQKARGFLPGGTPPREGFRA